MSVVLQYVNSRRIDVGNLQAAGQSSALSPNDTVNADTTVDSMASCVISPDLGVLCFNAGVSDLSATVQD